MSKIISEESPEAQQQPSNTPESGGGGAKDKIRKQARQLAYDTRYKVKKGFAKGQKTDAVSLKRAYLSQLQKSPAPGPVRALAKKMLVGEEYDFTDVSELITDSVNNAFNKVFVKKTDLEDAEGNPAYEVIDFVQEASTERKYQVRVTDKETKKTYVRMATREKISQLRSNPKISSVEMTGHGDPYEGKKKADKDYDGDGKRETSKQEWKGSRDKAIKKSIAKEEFIDEVKDPENDNPDANVKKIDVMKGKNKIKINPNQCEAVDPATGNKEEPDAGVANKQKRVSMMKRQILQKKMQAVRSGAGADIVAHNELEGEVIQEKPDISDILARLEKKRISKGGNPDESPLGKKTGQAMKAKQDAARKKAGIKEDAKYGYDSEGNSLNPKDIKKKKKEEEDYRGMKTKVNLVRNKVRAMGLNMSHEPEGKMIEGYQRDPEQQKKERTTSKQSDPSKDNFTGISGSIATIMKQNAAMKKAASKKVKKEEYDNTKSPDYEKKKKALAKKHGGADKIKGHPQYETYTVTAADKAGNTPAWQAYKAGKKNVKTGEPLYKAADHLKKNEAFDAEKDIARSILEKKYDTLATEAKVDTVKKLDDEGKEDARNYRKYGTKHNQFMQAVRRRGEHRSERGVKKIKGQKPAPKGAYGEETVLELNRYGKETGKATGSLNKRPGTPVKTGGTSSPVMRAVRSSIRRETGKPEGQQKKERGKKPPVAGEYGARRSPAQIVQNRRASKARADAAMRDTRGT